MKEREGIPTRIAWRKSYFKTLCRIPKFFQVLSLLLVYQKYNDL